MTEEQLTTINFLTESEYEESKNEGTINENEMYLTIDSSDESHQKSLFSGKLTGGNYIVIPNLNKYKKLEITWGAYDTNNYNTGGVSNVLILDLEKYSTIDNKKIAIAGNAIAYFNKAINDSTSTLSGTFYIRAEANLTENKFGCAFCVNTSFQNNNEYYYVSKIVGYK